MVYAYSENFILALSHDEVVYGKQAIVSKMPGDEWQRFANTRAYYGFMWGHPGKKLLFMGQEFGQTTEWDAESELPWWLLDHAPHQGVKKLIGDLNAFYRSTPAMYERDCEPEGFRWIVGDDSENSVIAFLRFGAEGRAADRRDLQFHAGRASRLPHRPARHRALGGGDQHGCARILGLGRRQFWRGLRRPSAVARSAGLRRPHAAAALDDLSGVAAG